MRLAKPVLVIENASNAPAGLVGLFMQEHGISFEVVRVPQDQFPTVTDYAALIVLGGPQHVGNHEDFPYFVPEESVIRQALTDDVPMLGICLGGQLLAHTLGAHVGRHQVAEVGFRHVRLTEAGARDPLFQEVPDPQLVLEWHVDAFSLPATAVLLARGDEAPHQAFSFARRAYGLQYHIEVLPEVFEQWLIEESRELGDAMGPQAILELREEWRHNYPAFRAQSSVMIRNFLRVAEII